MEGTNGWKPWMGRALGIFQLIGVAVGASLVLTTGEGRDTLPYALVALVAVSVVPLLAPQRARIGMAFGALAVALWLGSVVLSVRR
ncbi:MAG: hypothetical protein R3F59_15885 [Myxococcota bacterium]